MPWVHAKLKGEKVFARANERGELLQNHGRVEVRYRPKDGRFYQASASNLTVVDPTPLPDDTCAEAERAPRLEVAPNGVLVPRKEGGAGRSAGTAAPRAGRAGPRRADAIAARSASPGSHAPREGAVVIYTDGACSGNPGPAGLGVVVVESGRTVEISEYLGQGTNNIAELTAILRALEAVADKSRAIDLHTDSQYAIGVLQKGWKAKANQALIATLRARLAEHEDVRLVYVPGHAGVAWNEKADELAREAVTRRGSRTRESARTPKE